MKIHLCKVTTNEMGHNVTVPMCTKNMLMGGTWLHITEFTTLYEKNPRACCAKCAQIANLTTINSPARTYVYNRSNQMAVYVLQPESKYKRLREYAMASHGILDMNNTGSRYYWAVGLTGHGDWFCGGYYVNPVCGTNFPDVFIELSTGKAFKFHKVIN
jgi:hypothetical protein